MPPTAPAPTLGEAIRPTFRTAGRAALAEALRATRADTLATFDAYVAALGAPTLAVPYRTTLNPPLWELGHIGWFQEFWIARNPERERGAAADPDAPRPDSIRPGGDALYNSSLVAHASRWHLPLPGIAATRDDLARQLDAALALLAETPEENDAALYFYRLVLAHEDMHHEAAVYMAHALGFDLPDARWQPAALPADNTALRFAAAAWRLGHDGAGFAFDNERLAQPGATADYAIDRRPVTWREWIAFVDAGGYADLGLWDDAGQQWLQAQAQVPAPGAALKAQATPTPVAAGPLALRRTADGAWQRRRGARWLDAGAGWLDEAACHLSFHEAQAWCRFAGRRLPTEAEWERAALEGGAAFAWGQVWEWTASPFAPFPGFEPHPYRDYSQPWFDGRPVLKGGSWATQPRMKHPRYRNFFTAERRDIVAGLRTCAV